MAARRMVGGEPAQVALPAGHRRDPRFTAQPGVAQEAGPARGGSRLRSLRSAPRALSGQGAEAPSRPRAGGGSRLAGDGEAKGERDG